MSGGEAPMVFCTNCGSKEADNSKFCHKCGTLLVNEVTMKSDINQIKNDIVKDTEEEPKIISKPDDILEQTFKAEIQGSRANELGVLLEKAVEKILKAEGYTTERRKTIGERVTSQIDIVASKMRHGNKEEILVECKNYSSPIPVKEIQAFLTKMRELGNKRGLIAVHPRFSQEAMQWGQNEGLKLWDWENIKEKLCEIEVGRYGISEIGIIKYFLPLKVSYNEAILLSIENKKNVEISKVKLIWKPYYVFRYKLKCIRINPVKNKVVIEDDGTYIIDALTGNFMHRSDAVKNVVNKILGQSKQDGLKIKENDIVLQELLQNPETDLNLHTANDYEILILKPIEQEEYVKKRVLEEIIEDNAQNKPYTLKRDEDNIFADQHEFRVTPSAKEITLNSAKCIYLPKWDIEYSSKEYSYMKTLTGNSGSIIYDTITYCNKHTNIGFTKKKTVAVCDICGEALCKEHIWKCKTCGSWRCLAHVKTCADCQGKYCQGHINISCSECKEDICDSCATKCVICAKIYCKKHLTKCSKCGKIVCVNCSVKEGGLLKIGQKVYCTECKS
jgi:hypothetical protein